MALHVCERCGGFVPSTIDHCPHCRAAERRGRRLVASALVLGAALVGAVCVPACAYGDFSPDPVDAAVDGAGDGGAGDATPLDAAPDATVR